MTYKYKYDAGSSTPSGTNNTTLCNAWNAYLVNIGAIAAAIDIPNGVYGDDAATIASKTKAVMDQFKDADIKTKVIAKGSHRHGQVTYYKAGISYYPIMIKHDNDDSASVTNEFGEFGVVRNSVYDINITKVNKPGYPTIPKPGEPEGGTPDEEDENYLSIKINVNPWTWYTQNVEL